MSYAIDGLSSSHPNKRGKFSLQSLNIDSKINFASISEREEIKLTLLYLMLMIRSKLILKKKIPRPPQWLR